MCSTSARIRGQPRSSSVEIPGGTPLPSRVDAVGAGVTLVLRHVNMSGLVAVAQPTFSGLAAGGEVGVEFAPLLCQPRLHELLGVRR